MKLKKGPFNINISSIQTIRTNFLRKKKQSILFYIENSIFDNENCSS